MDALIGLVSVIAICVFGLGLVAVFVRTIAGTVFHAARISVTEENGEGRRRRECMETGHLYMLLDNDPVDLFECIRCSDTVTTDHMHSKTRKGKRDS